MFGCIYIKENAGFYNQPQETELLYHLLFVIGQIIFIFILYKKEIVLFFASKFR